MLNKSNIPEQPYIRAKFAFTIETMIETIK